MDRALTYERRIVCFIDILGFSVRIKGTEKKTDEAKDLLNKTCNALEQIHLYITIIERDSGIKGIQITQFSDSIVISFPWRTDSTELHIVLKAIKYIQVTMLKMYGILMRGGIVIGDLIHTDRLLVGPAMIAAYEIESKCALSPRIVVDPKVAYRYGLIRKKLKPDEAKKRVIHKDLDDTSFIDYFNIDEDTIFDENEIRDYFKLLCKLVADNVSSSDMSIRMKYLWMRNKIKNCELYSKPEFKALYRKIVTEKK